MSLDEHNRRVLVIEDDDSVGFTISELLSSIGFEPVVARRAAEAFHLLHVHSFIVAIIDLTLPDADGLDVVRDLSRAYDMGIIIVTGRLDRVDRVLGLELGADDFIAKPFDRRELTARIKSLARRIARARRQPGAASASQALPLAAPRAPWDKVPLKLLRVFMAHPNRILERGMILDLMYGNAAAPFDRSIDVKIARLRRKIEPDPRRPRFIRTIRHQGYLFDPNGKAS